MTCIIAHRLGWMVADRRVTFGEGYTGPYRRNKIRRSSDILVGCAGPAVLSDRIEDALRGDSLVHGNYRAIVATVREHGTGSNTLILTANGITELDQKGAAFDVDAEFWAVGSGFEAALGWLHGRYVARTGCVTPEDAKAAISFAAQLHTDIGDGFQVERL